MKKVYKILLITLLSLIGVVILAVGTVCTIVFSPKILVPIVEKNLNKMETFSFGLENAELVFFKTFPRFSVHIESFDVMTAPENDTLARIDDLYASIDVMAFVRRNDVIVDKLSLDGGYADLTLLPESPSDIELEDSISTSLAATIESFLPLPFSALDIDRFSIDNFNLKYGDSSMFVFVEEIDTDLYIKGFHDFIAHGGIDLALGSLTFSMGDTLLCDRVPVKLSLPFEVSLQNDSLAVAIDRGALDYSGVELRFGGNAQIDGDAILTDLGLQLVPVKLQKLVSLLPQEYSSLVDGYGLSGEVSLEASAQGILGNDSLPVVNGELLISDAGGEILSLFPYRISDIDAKIVVDADLNGDGKVNARIPTFSARFNRTNTLQIVNGRVNDILGEMICDATVDAQLNLPDFLYIVPDSMNVDLNGRMSLSVDAKGSVNDFVEMRLGKTNLSASVVLTDLDAVYQDTVFVATPSLSLTLANNTSKREQISKCEEVNGKFDVFYAGKLKTEAVDFTMGGDLYGTLTASEFAFGLSDVLDNNLPVSAFIDYSLEGLYASLSNIEAAVVSPSGTIALLPDNQYWCNYASEELYVRSGEDIELETDAIILDARAQRDSAAVGLLAQWNPQIIVDFSNGDLFWKGIEDNIHIPAIKFDYGADTLHIEDSRLQVGNSDFKLIGEVTDLSDFAADSGLLRADFNFISERTDIDQLLDYFSGMGVEEESLQEGEQLADLSSMEDISSQENSAEEESQPETNQEGDPFMVPGKIDLTLNTDIAQATAFGNDIKKVGGEVTIKDGVLVVRQLGFTSDAARMQLTAMYKSPRRNHLYAGIDFHLLDIEIDKLIKMVPQIDSVVPMLKSFAGQAEFHLAAETYLNSKYELKKSTLLGAAAIEGRDLVVLDSETFDKIASLLNFKKSQENKIDSLVVDMTVFRNEVDIYPFVVGMDKYQLILSGRHNLDMSFDYHIDCISPIRLGLDIKGTFDDLKFGLTPTRYKNLFVPERRNDIQERTLKLMDLINTSLKEKVVEE
ncbi:MAG: hypothetical protein IKC17_02840 [Bacteroidales bacterium]|nr:hypothetical protein [Bacteroidales bacterium]